MRSIGKRCCKAFPGCTRRSRKGFEHSKNTELQQKYGVKYLESIIQRVMKNPDFATGIARLQENLKIVTGTDGNVAPENRAAWNISNALIVVLDSLQRIQQQFPAANFED